MPRQPRPPMHRRVRRAGSTAAPAWLVQYRSGHPQPRQVLFTVLPQVPAERVRATAGPCSGPSRAARAHDDICPGHACKVRHAALLAAARFRDKCPGFWSDGRRRSAPSRRRGAGPQSNTSVAVTDRDRSAGFVSVGPQAHGVGERARRYWKVVAQGRLARAALRA